LEEDFDHLLQLGEEEATGHQGATVYDNHSYSATRAIPIRGSRQSLVKRINSVGQARALERQKALQISRIKPTTIHYRLW
jgi:hypothetical protein